MKNAELRMAEGLKSRCKHVTLTCVGLLLLLGYTFLIPTARGQAVVQLSADTIALGDQTTLSISRALNYPSTDMLSAGDIVALGQMFDSASHTQHTVLTCFEPGLHYVHIGPDDSLPLMVTDVEIDTATAELRDIAPIVRIPYSFMELFRWVLLVWAVAIVVLVAWWLIDRKRRHGSIIVHHEPVDTRTPDERALQALEALRLRQLWQSGNVKAYHTELTDIVRRFIEEATGIRATEMTSDETVEAVKSGKYGVDSSMLRDIFTTADLVKFAKSEPLPHEHDRSMSNAVAFVNGMWEKVKPTEKEEEAES